ncbi:MAG: GNAT family acetyltransferase [Pseudomonadota bacterium]
MLEIRPFQDSDEEAIVELWRDCELLRPTNDPHRDIELKRAVQPDLFLVGILHSRVVASVMAGYEGHRGWLNYLAVAPTCRHRGFGRAIVAAAEDRLRLIGCPKINLQVRVGNARTMEFYQKIGFQMDDVVSLGKRLNYK